MFLFFFKLSEIQSLANPYEHSISGKIKIKADFDPKCLEEQKTVMAALRIIIYEKDGISQRRATSIELTKNDLEYNYRVPYKDYMIRFIYTKNLFRIEEINLSAYNSPPSVTIKFDCNTITKEISDIIIEKVKKEAEAKSKQEGEAAPKPEH
jgi:hypothetical protein